MNYKWVYTIMACCLPMLVFAQPTTLKDALAQKDTTAALKLIQMGQNPNQLDGEASLLSRYCRYSVADPMAMFLLRHGAKPDTLVSPAGRTALHVAAAYYACEELCDALLKAGANINARTKDGASPLMLAAQSAKLRLVNFLLENGANPKLKDNKGQTAYEYALRADPMTDLPEARKNLEAQCGWNKQATVEKLKDITRQ
jgi:ankyrin repeat protein